MGHTAKLEKTTDAIDDKFDDTVVEDDASELLEEVDNEEDIFAKDEVAKNLDATQLYLGEIGFSPLLSAEEEVFFCSQSIERL